jgi:type I restriction enzyme S subunit
LGDVCEVLDNLRRPITKRDRVAGPFPYYGATGIVDHVGDYIFDEKLVLVGEDGAKWESGEKTAFIVEGKCWVNNHAHVLRPMRDIVIDEWLAYYLTHLDLAPWVGGLTVPKLNQGNLREIPIPLPPVAEQKRIVAILDEAFDGIAKATANAERNLANARELFVRAIAKRLAEVPVERIAPVRDLASDERGAIRTGPFGSQLLHSEFVDDGPIAVLGIDNVVDNEFTWKRRRYITAEKYAGLQRYTVKPGDVLISIMGTCGRCAVVPDEIEPAINSKHLCCITLDRSKCLPAFLHTYFLLHPTARAYLAAQSKGSIMDGLNMGIIQDMPVELPSLQNQRTIGALAETLREKSEELVKSYEQKCARLAELRQSILHKAFSGQLTGKEAIAA